jgi:capsular polysaccharide transport system permease protein
VADYQELLLNQQFAETAYTAALGSLERARAEADRTQSYLAIYLKPNAPDAAIYPQRGWNIFLVFLLAAVVWAVGSLAFLTARDHLT